MQSITRRNLIAGLAASGLGAAATAAFPEKGLAAERPVTFLEILRQPDSVTAFLGLDRAISLVRSGGQWEGGGVRVVTESEPKSLAIRLSAPAVQPTHLHLRWNAAVSGDLLVLGDAWERSYGELRWSSLIPERAMPWYFLTRDGDSLHGYGVKTGAGALCFWQVDPDGVSLWLDVCNGGSGVELGGRELLAARVVSRRGESGEEPMQAARAFCATMCDAPRSAVPLIYGSNDWYYAYGKNSAAQIVRDAELMASLAPSGGARPFTVVDDGWKNKAAYPDMAALAGAIRERSVRPGLWIRPLQATRETSSTLRLPDERFGSDSHHAAPAYDPTIPEALELILDKVKEAVGWGYELVKHDFSTYELFGQWGFEMQAQPTKPGWAFHDRSKTNAEIVLDLYHAIRSTAGERTIVIGCNTIGHLGAGIFDGQRTGDDVSGRNWERTRRIGINTLAYRLPQHRTFFLLDADCVPITTTTPWECNRQWLDLLARSGTVLLVSPEPKATGEEQRQALREAFQHVVSAGDSVSPVDWQENTTPGQWEFTSLPGNARVKKGYDWYQNSGAWPFGI
jgi:alpha-galactosidase